MIKSLTIPFVRNIYKRPLSLLAEIKMVRHGLPIVEFNGFDINLMINEKRYLEVVFDENRLAAFFSDHVIFSKIVCHNVSFLLDQENYFCGFIVEDLDDSAEKILDKYYKWHASRLPI